MGLLIREALAADRDALVEQFGLLNQFENLITDNMNIDDATAEASMASADDYVASKNGSRLVADIDGLVVGFLYFVVQDDEPYIREEFRRYGHVCELFVLETVRGTGVARALMAEAERLAIADGAKRMTISVLIGNDGAERAYESLGFKPYHQRMAKAL